MTSDVGDGQFYDREQQMLESGDPVQVAGAEALLRERDARHPDDALVQYLIASAFDSAGREREAVLHYERAFTIGVEHLPERRRPEIFVQAGSTLRNLGRLEDARKVLQDGIVRFPGYRALYAFLALVEASAGAWRQTATLLFEMAIINEEPSLQRYRRSLMGYVGELSPEE